MKNKLWVVLTVAIIWIFIIACESSSSTSYNGKSGSANETNSSCESSGKQGMCSGRLNNLSGTFYKEISNTSIRATDKQANVTVNITVGNGDVSVYLLDSRENKTAVEVKAGKTGELKGVAVVTSKKFKIFFETGSEKIDQVDYSIKYSVE